jgi:hypothetical protein
MKAALIALVLAVPPGHSAAPVYSYLTDHVLVRTGTFVYKSSDMKVVYCISQPPKVAIQCVVRTPADRLVLIDAEVTEHTT